MSRSRTVPERVTDWLAAYNAIRDEVTPPVMRTMFTELAKQGAEGLNASMALARVVMANDRACALAAAMLTSSGGAPRPVILDGDDVG